MRMLALALASLVLAAQSGCARRLHSGPLPPPPSEEVRSQLGRVVVRSDSDLLAESVIAPAIAGSCSAAGLGALAGLVTGLDLSLRLFQGFKGTGGGGGGAGAIIFAVIFFAMVCIAATVVVVCLLGGSLWGLSKAPSSESLERAREIISKAVLERRFTDGIKASVVEKAKRDTDAQVAAWVPGGDRDTILEISGPRVVFRGGCSFDAPIRLTSEIEVRLIRSRDGAVLHSFWLRRSGGERSFDDWVGGDGSAVVRELGDPEAFAERIVDEIFLLVDVPEGARR